VFKGSLIAAVALGLTLAGSASFASAQDAAKAKALKNPVKPTEASIKAGAQVFTAMCRHCHGALGRGDGMMASKKDPPADLADAKWEYGASDGEIFNIIMNGVPKEKSVMKGVKGKLADTDVWNIVNFLRDLGKKRKT
jgi:mono/diheme cytochrome c family protein